MISSILCVNKAQASKISANDVISFMEKNNILDDSEYFYMFGKMLNGNNEYDINSFKYTITTENSKINIKTTLEDEKTGKIEKTTTFTMNDNIISYTNSNDVNSLESRIDTILFSQLIYSIGGARGYNQDILVDWMNQINLSTVTEKEGINCTFKNVKYNTKQENSTYEYEISVPITYTIDINKITENIPTKDIVEIKNTQQSASSVTLTVNAENHKEEMCSIYRKNDNKYELVGKVSCNNGVFKDKDLKEGTSYYYQATIEDQIMCSKEIAVIPSKNPLTGASLPFYILLISILIGMTIYIISKKYKKVVKI